MTLLVIVLILSLLAYLAPKFGVDSHESREWAYRDDIDLRPLHR